MARTKTVAPHGDILDSHMSHNVYVCACVRMCTRVCVCVCVNKEKATC